jgi:hypothetical protein
MSGRMAAIVAYVLDEHWTDPEIAWLSVSSDGHVVSDAHFLGSSDDLDRNVRNLLDAADLSPEQRAEWAARYCAKVDDWRNGHTAYKFVVED